MRILIGMLASAAAGCCLSETQASDPVALAEAENRITSILNAGVTAELGEVKFLFDPLYDNHFGSLEELDEPLIDAIITGAPPYDDVDAVFVSHAHGDHFSARHLNRLLKAQPTVILVAPGQAIDAMREHAQWEVAFGERVVPVVLDNGAAAFRTEIGGATIEAIRTPHTGWPERHENVHNITFRISSPSGARVMHLGDADPGEQHFAPHTEFFASARTGLALVPYWFFGEDDPAKLVGDTLNAQGAVGMHVPANKPAWLDEAGGDVFTGVDQARPVPVTPTP